MKQRINGILTLMIVLVSQLTFAQNILVSGKVADPSGMPVSGVNVKVKGTSSSTQTDFDGTYSIKANTTDVLVFSYIGMSVKEAKVTGSKVNVVLSSAASNELVDVVVTAYGIKRDKKALGYSAQQISAEQVNSVPTTNFVNNLAGKVAGLEIKQGTNFGGSTNVVLRGYKSILGGNQALFVVDGVPILNSNVNSNGQTNGQQGYDYGNAASDINPNDIANLVVLKGAAATALYGSRGANGALIITTKKGKFNSDLSVEFSSSLTTSTVDKSTFPTYQSEYGEGYDGVFDGSYLGTNATNFNDDASYGPKYDNSQVYAYNAFVPGSPNFGKTTTYKFADNGPITFFKTGISTVNNITLSAGGDKASFRFNYGNTNANDILPNGYLNKNNFTGTTTYKFNDKLSATINANYVVQNTKGRNATGYDDGNILTNFRQWWPTNVDIKEQQQLYDGSGQNYTWNINSPTNIKPLYWNNPYFTRYENFETDARQRFAGNVSLSYDVNKHINLLARVGTDGFNLKTEERKQNGSIAGDIGLQTAVQPSGYALSLYTVRETNYDFLATFKTDLTKDLNLNLILGTNLTSTTNDIIRQSTSGGLFIPGFYTISNSTSAPSLPITTSTRLDNFGAFTQASLGYQGTLYLEGSFRNDTSSSLLKGVNNYNYYSVSSSFVFSNLNFLKNNNIMNFGKVRASYAEVGGGTNPNLLLNTYNPATPFASPLYSINTTAKLAALKPIRLISKELGVNLQFAKNRIGIDVAWFENKATNQILALPVSFSSGFAAQNQNAGTLSTKGYEVSFNATPIKSNNFSWDLNLNWSNPKTKVTELAPGIENIQIGSFQGGVSVNAPLNQDYGTLWGTTYVDAPDGQHIIASNGAYKESTTVNNNLGSYQADWTAGINNKFTYKNVSFSFLIDIKKGGHVFSLDQYYGYGTGLYPDSVGTNDLGNPVRNDIASGGGQILQGVMSNPAYVVGNGQPQYIPNTTRLDRSQSSQLLGTDLPRAAFVYDASFVKLRELQITYNLPARFLKNLAVKSTSFSLIGNNVWIIDKKLPYADPEAGLSSGNIQGFQSGVMPTSRNISFNVKVNF